jgi:hypothetical protein
MCRQFVDSDGLPIVVLRPDGIIDLRHGVRRTPDGGPGRSTTPLRGGAPPRLGSVCRYDIAAACRAAVQAGGAEDRPELEVFECLHVAAEDTSLPRSERASAYCNVGRTAALLGVSFEHDLSAFAGNGGMVAKM